MSKLIILLIQEFLEGVIDFFGDKLTNVVTVALYPEKSISGVSVTGFNNVFTIFLKFGIAMIVLKFLKKGFDIYILWTDGDADAEPIVLLTNFFKAMAIALCFNIMYEWLANIIIDATDMVLNAIQLDADTNLVCFTKMLGKGLFCSIFILVFFIIYLILYIQFIVNGWKMLILRLGIPLACVGLMDANQGVFRTYIQKFFQVSLTLLVQVVLTKFAFALMVEGDIIWGMAALIMGIKTPRFLQEFLILPERNGSGINTVYSGARIFQMLKRR